MSIMKKNSCVWFVMGLLVLIVSTEFVQVDGRALRSDDSTTGVGCKEQAAGGAEEMAGMGSFAVSSSFNSSSNDNSTTHRPSVRSLMFRLASGPSKKGPGH